jgi:hypothetical protein
MSNPTGRSPWRVPHFIGSESGQFWQDASVGQSSISLFSKETEFNDCELPIKNRRVLILPHLRENVRMNFPSLRTAMFLSTLNPIAKFALAAYLSVFASSFVVADQWGQKLFSETHHHFGTVSRNAKTEHAFVIENCFEEDVHIASVRSSCGCTNPIITKNTLKTWEKGEIIAQFNTRSFIGTKTAEITVVIDRPYYAEVKLTVGGTIRSDIVVEPGEVRFGDVDQGEKKVVDLKISYAGRPDWRITDIRGNSDQLEVRLDPAQKNGTRTNYNLHIMLKNTAPVGDLIDELIVITNDEKNDQFTLPVNARVIPPVSISPTLVSLGDIAKGKSVQNRLIVRSKKPFSITDVDCGDARFEFKLPEGAKTMHVVPFTFVGTPVEEADGGTLMQKIRVRTSLGDDLSAEVTVAGRVID